MLVFWIRLLPSVRNKGYKYQFKNNKFYGLPFEVNEMINHEGVKDYISSITDLRPRDYQIDVCP